jgi:hypothetical protein
MKKWLKRSFQRSVFVFSIRLLAAVLAVCFYVSAFPACAAEDFEFKWVIPPENYNGFPFTEDRAWMRREEGGPWTLYDIDGNIIKDGFEAERFYRYKDGFAFFMNKKRKNGLVNRSGDVVLQPNLSSSANWGGEGLIIEKNKKGLYGAVDMNSEWVVHPEYQTLYEFNDGLALASKDGKCGYIDIKGKTVIDFVFDDAGPFNDGAAIAKVGILYGLIDKQGKFLVEPKYIDINYYGSKNGPIGVVTKDGKVGFIDKNGNTVIDFKFSALIFDNGKIGKSLLHYFNCGRAIVLLEGSISERKADTTDGLHPYDDSKLKRAVIDETGNIVFTVDSSVVLHTPFYFDDYIAGWLNGKPYLWDKNGRAYDLSPYIDKSLIINNAVERNSKRNVFHVYNRDSNISGHFTIIPKGEN